MKKFKCLLTAMLLGCSTMSFAQFMNGSGSSASSSSDVEAWKGLRFSYHRVFTNHNFDDPDDLDMNGFSVDYEHAFKVAKKLPLFIQTGIGINFSRHSDSESESDEYYGYTVGYESKNSITQLGLNIPINLVYGVKINEQLAIKPYTGFYLRVNLMAKEKEEFTLNIPSEFEDYIDRSDYEYDESYNLFDKDDVNELYGSDDWKWNRVQFGWQIGATLDISKFNVGIGYALDFNEITEKTKTSKFMVKLGYNF